MRKALIIVLAAAATPALARGASPAVCRSHVAPMYGVTPDKVTTGAVLRQKKGGYALKGAVDKGVEGMKPFQCLFDRRGRLVDVMSLVDEGAL